MAMIKCPECGQDISDKAVKCPKCGYPLETEPIKEDVRYSKIPEQIVNAEPVSQIQKKENSKKKIVIGIICLGIALMGIALWLKIGIFESNLSVGEINLSKWKLIDEGKYFDEYEGSIISDETKPFVAVIGYYEESDDTPMFVYMENGKGTLQRSESTDEDPSIKYTVIGYMNGRALKESDVSSITYDDSDYNDWYSDTSCTVTMQIELKSNKDGLLAVEIRNDLTKEVERNVMIPIVSGKGEYEYYLSDLPLKSRGVEVTATPKIFCISEKIKETDYTVDTPFSVEKDEMSSSISYIGKEELTFTGYADGLVLYTQELLDGGRKEERGEVVRSIADLKDSQCTLQTGIWADDDEKILTPSYDIKKIGYLSWNKYEKK